MLNIKESDLYPPIRNYLAAQGYVVKGEVNSCDVVAVRSGEPAVIVELKIRLNLELILQAGDRLKLSDSVYIAFPASSAMWKRHWKRVRALCQRLGIGIITLDGKPLKVNVRLDPAPFKPRASKQRSVRLLAEFKKRVGDQNTGGVTGEPIMTAYRQDALRCVSAFDNGATSLADVRAISKISKANSILQKNHYGWFQRVSHGHYQLSPKGLDAATQNAQFIAQLLAEST